MIFASLRSHARLFVRYVRLNLLGALEYRASFLMQAFSMALSNSAFIFFWWIAFSALQGRIGGYTFEDMMFVWSVTSSAFGLSHVLFGNAGRLSQLILTGELDTYLLQPKNVLLNMLCAHTSLAAWGDFAYGFVLMALTQRGLQVWAVFVLATAVGAVLITAIALSAHSLTFFIGNASVIGGMVQEFMLNFCLYPIGIFPLLVRVLMYTALPAALIVHLPLMLAHSFRFELLLVLLGGGAVYCGLACWIFYRGLRRYESGNLIVTRL